MTPRTARFAALLTRSGFLCSALGAAGLEHAPAQWRGAWPLDRDAGASAIGALDSAQARALLGTFISQLTVAS